MLPSGGVDEGTNDVALVIDSLSIGGRRPGNIEDGNTSPAPLTVETRILRTD